MKIMARKEVIESNKKYIAGTDYGDGRIKDIETASAIAFDKGVEYAVEKVCEVYKKRHEMDPVVCGCGFYYLMDMVDEFRKEINKAIKE